LISTRAVIEEPDVCRQLMEAAPQIPFVVISASPSSVDVPDSQTRDGHFQGMTLATCSLAMLLFFYWASLGWNTAIHHQAFTFSLFDCLLFDQLSCPPDDAENQKF
jgi:hypothetical protein